MNPTQKELRAVADELENIERESASLIGAGLNDEGETKIQELAKRKSALLEKRAALGVLVAADEEKSTVANDGLDPEGRERLELRSKAMVTNHLVAALQGKEIRGAEAEHMAAVGVSQGIPLDLWQGPRTVMDISGSPFELRDSPTTAPNTTGQNLQMIQPAVFAPSIAGALSIEMPSVESGAFAELTISTSATATALAEGSAAVASPLGFQATTAKPKRISARLGTSIEAIAEIGTSSFEPRIRENISLALSDKFDDELLNGDGSAPRINGMFNRLADPATPASTAVSFTNFAKTFGDGLDGLFAETLNDVVVICGPKTGQVAAQTFMGTGADPRSPSALAYLAEHTGGLRINKRVPDPENDVQSAILHRRGRSPGVRTAVVPMWAQSIMIEDIFSGSASGLKFFTTHILVGNLIVTQAGAYSEVAFRTVSV